MPSDEGLQSNESLTALVIDLEAPPPIPHLRKLPMGRSGISVKRFNCEIFTLANYLRVTHERDQET